jgi:hypothetical protein
VPFDFFWWCEQWNFAQDAQKVRNRVCARKKNERLRTCHRLTAEAVARSDVSSSQMERDKEKWSQSRNIVSIHPAA